VTDFDLEVDRAPKKPFGQVFSPLLVDLLLKGTLGVYFFTPIFSFFFPLSRDLVLKLPPLYNVFGVADTFVFFPPLGFSPPSLYFFSFSPMRDFPKQRFPPSHLLSPTMAFVMSDASLFLYILMFFFLCFF